MASACKGWLVSNGGLQMPKFAEQLDWLASTFEAAGISIRRLFNQELIATVLNGFPVILVDGQVFGTEESHVALQTVVPSAKGRECSVQSMKKGEMPDFVMFWDKDVRLAFHMEQSGFRLFNTAAAIAACDDKSATHRILSGHGIPMPDTLVSPFFFPGLGAVKDSFVSQVEQVLGYPVVVKESFGSFGAQVYLAENREALFAHHLRLQDVPHLCQRFVKTSMGRDVRLQVVGDRVVAAMLRTSQGDFRANVSAGARMESFAPSADHVDVALRTSRLLGLHFAGVDLLFGENEEPLVCEVNSNAHMRNIQQCTGVDVPLAIVKHIRKELQGMTNEAERGEDVW